MHRLVKEYVRLVLRTRTRSRLLREGGLVGHLQHLYDNKELTFGEIKDILRNAGSGKLERVSEKMDGMNLVFSYDLSSGGLKVTRGSDIMRGGMDAAALAAKFAGRGSVEEAFTSAFRVLEEAVGSLPQGTLQRVFGLNADRWYSIEVIYTKNPNVINYDSNNLVFHGWPVFERKEIPTGGVSVEIVEDDRGGVDTLAGNVEVMQRAVTDESWTIRGPAIVRMKDLSNGSAVQEVVARINDAMTAAGVGDGDTIRTYLMVPVNQFLGQFQLSPEAHDAVVARIMDDPGAMSLVDIRRMIDKESYVTISQFVKNIPMVFKRHVRPIEVAINDFAVELLNGVGSSLIGNTDAEVQRLRAEVRKAVAAIQSSGDEKSMTVLAAQLEKLKSIENITSPMEGVVFIYKGNAYKFTGSFAAANQILGIFKYGR